MSNQENFIKTIEEGYQFEGKSIVLGGAMLQGECITNSLVKLPLRTLNRHGLIAGATGSGKTKTLQILAEQLSAQGVPSLLMDIKGDLSGIAAKSDGHPKIEERHEKIGIPFEANSSPVELLTLSEEKGVRLRATVTEFGPVLFSKMLNLTEAQQGIMAIIFKYCDDHKIPLIDLKDLRKILQYITAEGKEQIKAEYGAVSAQSAGAITRKLIELEQQDAEIFFGEPSFEVDDLCRTDDEGKGVVSIIRLTDLQDRPKLFSTFMLQLLAEIYATFPEEGDLEQPKLVIFIDEAHLVFKNASSTLLGQLEAIIKLIRSKGVGLFFITQNPVDVPENVLGQLGLKIQHALRAFTAKDRKAIKLAAQNYPLTDFYEVEDLLTNLGIGEAMITALGEDGRPTPLAHTLLRAPQSRMDVLTDSEIDALVRDSELIDKYSEVVDRESAYEILSKKIETAQEEDNQDRLRKQKKKAKESSDDKNIFEEMMGSTVSRQVGRTVISVITRGLLGAIGVKGKRRLF